MTDDTPLPFDLPAVRRKKLTVDFSGGTQSSDAGLLLLREAERKLGVCGRLAAAMPDRRDPDRILHAMFEMVTARVSAIACGYKDAIDLDRLRHDPLMKATVGRCPETGAPLASQSTISRLENSPSKTDAARLGVAMLDQFCATVKPGPIEMLDIDDTFCAAHGGQQLASDRMSCHSATANQVRLALHTAAYWLMLAVRDAIPQKDPLAKAEFATIRERLIKIGARVIEHLARIRIQLPTSCPEGRLFRAVALRLAPSSG